MEGREAGEDVCQKESGNSAMFNVTSFKCGGFAIGMSTNHILFDDLGAKVFLLNLASQSIENKPLATVPYNDRRILATRSPPHVSFPHSEFLKFDLPVGPGSTPPKFDCIIEELDFKIFKLNTTHISHLKDDITKTSKIERISTLAVVAALIWRCKAYSDDKNRVCTLLNVIDIRPRVNPHYHIRTRPMQCSPSDFQKLVKR
ncbi:PREDICTED: omega-hydroxypalmitate O-feruloyl transferase-like [Erythranthe guttata]|uniref:omega-hydroxypalmitate O-feruloyl transferase-like n=1 Tax=Erythranthe guttata TaxID=4155 RepID=UPI00064DAE48|nr:PREDICTED: omega-hydroxypalmitate O-feruloyl transferase-like [Erythranthe guttata]|eukprot:XP_012841141.1 PREDICTED: omega-hydroxypalmitate O-feruloyl transferase-like [Erythranthe guttata]